MQRPHRTDKQFEGQRKGKDRVHMAIISKVEKPTNAIVGVTRLVMTSGDGLRSRTALERDNANVVRL